MTTQNGNDSILSISAANNAGLGKGLLAGKTAATVEIKGNTYNLTSVVYDITTSKYHCEFLSATGKKGTAKFNGDKKVAVKSLITEITPEPEKIEVVKPEVKVDEKVEAVATPQETPQETPKAEIFPSLASIVTRLNTDNTPQSKALLQRLDTLQTDLLDYLFSTPIAVTKPTIEPTSEPAKVEETRQEQAKAVEPEVVSQPKRGRGRPPKAKSATETAEITPVEKQRKTQTKGTPKERKMYLNTLTQVYKDTTKNGLTGAQAAEKYDLPASNIAAVICGYVLAKDYRDQNIFETYIKGDVSWNVIRGAGQHRKMLGDKLAVQVALGKISLDDAKAKAKK